MNPPPGGGGGAGRGDRPTPTMPGRGAKRTNTGDSPRGKQRARARPNKGQAPSRPDRDARTRQRVGLIAFADHREYTVVKAEARKAGISPPTLPAWVAPVVEAYAEGLDHADSPRETSHMRNFKSKMRRTEDKIVEEQNCDRAALRWLAIAWAKREGHVPPSLNMISRAVRFVANMYIRIYTRSDFRVPRYSRYSWSRFATARDV